TPKHRGSPEVRHWLGRVRQCQGRRPARLAKLPARSVPLRSYAPPQRTPKTRAAPQQAAPPHGEASVQRRSRRGSCPKEVPPQVDLEGRTIGPDHRLRLVYFLPLLGRGPVRRASLCPAAYPHWTALRLDRVTRAAQQFIIEVSSPRRPARCPACLRRS